MNPHMSRRYPTNYRILRYPRLSHPVFDDTMIYGTVSKRVNNNSHVYGPYLNEHVCFRLNRIVTLMRHYHYSSSVMVSYLKLSWTVPREILAATFLKNLREANCHQKTI